MKASRYFTQEQQKQIVEAIEAAELNTSGEIRVHIDSVCKENNVLDRAAKMFALLKMHKTALRNGVLIYLSVDDHKFAIIGDSGINAKVPANFWENTKNIMLTNLKEGKIVDALAEGITLAGEQLKLFFPYKLDDVNELDNSISFEK